MELTRQIVRSLTHRGGGTLLSQKKQKALLDDLTKNTSLPKKKHKQMQHE